MKLDQFLKNHFLSQTPNCEVDFVDLEKRVLFKITILEKRKRFRANLSYGTLFVTSSIGLVWASYSLAGQLSSSGIKDLFGMALTDSSVIFNHGADFFYSLLEAMPFMKLSESLIAVGAGLFAVRGIVNNSAHQSFNK